VIVNRIIGHRIHFTALYYINWYRCSEANESVTIAYDTIGYDTIVSV